MLDRNTVRFVLGSLALRPQLLGQVDKYVLTTNDFNTRFDRYVFCAIYGLYKQGVKTIEAVDIVNYLESDVGGKATFEQNNGIEWFNDILDFANPDNFDYYYNRLKKINLLRDLKKQGFDVSEFCPDDLTNPDADTSKFEDLTVSDICAAVRKKLLGLEASYARTGEIETEDASQGIRDLIEDLDSTIQLGAPVQGQIFNKVIGGAEKGALTIRSGSSGLGKFQPNSARIPTPSGWRTVGEIKPGDYLFDAFGKPTKVLQIFPQGKKEVWQVTFKDGRICKCGKEHLWSYNTSSQGLEAKMERDFYTEELWEIAQEPLQDKHGEYRILVPQQYAVEYPEKNHFLPPYIMGLLLGGGNQSRLLLNEDWQFFSEVEGFSNLIGEAMNLAAKENNENKFIPRAYLEDSIDNRFDLLNGLLDIGGSIDPDGRITCFSANPKLRDNVIELCQSLGLKASYSIDTYKNTLPCYIVYITGRPKDRIKLFRMKSKRKVIEEWCFSNKWEEDDMCNPIVKIENLGYKEESTCFWVDNPEHLYLAENFVPTHNTRVAMADALYLAYPIRYNSQSQKWEQRGSAERVLFIMTEQAFHQIRKMALAYLSDINEGRFKLGNFTAEEKDRLEKAAQIMEKYNKNLKIVKMPNPTIESLKMVMRENCLMYNIGYVFFDYIQINPGLLNEFRGASLRNDELLLLMSTTLKDLAVELDVSVFTATQVNASADDNRNIRNEASLSGGRATINKADNGAIMARPTRQELEALQPVIEKIGVIPNLVTDIFKVRSGEWSQVRIWSVVNLGTLKRKDLFVTDAQLDEVIDFDRNGEFEVHYWDEGEEADAIKMVCQLNKENIYVNDSTGEVFDSQKGDEDISSTTKQSLVDLI